MKLKCKNKKCLYEWEYKGDSPFYTSCPRCRSNVKLPDEEKVDQLVKEVVEDK